jgi:hypothetical protein
LPSVSLNESRFFAHRNSGSRSGNRPYNRGFQRRRPAPLSYLASDRLVSVGVTIPIVDGEFLMANDYFNLREHPIAALSAVTSWTGIADCDLTEQNPCR